MGGPKWTDPEARYLFISIHHFLPGTRIEWDNVKVRHDERWEVRRRTVFSLKKLFKDHYNPNARSMYPDMDEWARQIRQAIVDKNKGYLSDDNVEDKAGGKEETQGVDSEGVAGDLEAEDDLSFVAIPPMTAPVLELPPLPPPAAAAARRPMHPPTGVHPAPPATVVHPSVPTIPVVASTNPLSGGRGGVDTGAGVNIPAIVQMMIAQQNADREERKMERAQQAIMEREKREAEKEERAASHQMMMKMLTMLEGGGKKKRRVGNGDEATNNFEVDFT